MSEEKDMKELVGKLAEVVEKMTGIEVDKNSDKMIEATKEFSVAVEKFTEKLGKIDDKFKAYIKCGVIIDVSFAGDSKIRVVGGGREHINEVLDEIKERISK